MYLHILFDMDDTLLDFQKAQFVSFNAVLREFRIPFSENVYHCYEKINHSLWHKFEEGLMTKEEVQNERFAQFFIAMGLKIDGKQANQIYQKNLAAQYWLNPHAKETCRELSKRYSLSIVTNGVGITQRKRFNSSEISCYFSNLIISEDIGAAKPDKKFFEEAFKVIGCFEKDRILLVGDSLSSDIQGANNIGIDCCWYNPQKIALNKQAEIKHTITDLRQLTRIL